MKNKLDISMFVNSFYGFRNVLSSLIIIIIIIMSLSGYYHIKGVRLMEHVTHMRDKINACFGSKL
jgi:purine-cytosine permease-like protein